MIVCDQQREENFLEFIRLRNDPDYYDVTFDKSIGPFGYRRDYYEKQVVRILRLAGHSILLDQEAPFVYKGKTCDGLLDGQQLEIKTIEGAGRWAVRTKLEVAYRQRADVVILFFPDASLFSISRILTGWTDFLASNQNHKWPFRVLAIYDERIVEIEKPPR